MESGSGLAALEARNAGPGAESEPHRAGRDESTVGKFRMALMEVIPLAA